MPQIFDSIVLFWTASNNVQINTQRTKEMIFGCLSTANHPLLSTSAGSVECVTTFKLLGLNFDVSLSWSVLFTLLLSPPEPANDYTSWNSWTQRRFLPNNVYISSSMRCSNPPCPRVLHFGVALCRHSNTGGRTGVDIIASHLYYYHFLYHLLPSLYVISVLSRLRTATRFTRPISRTKNIVVSLL